jgi:hypothetical protein
MRIDGSYEEITSAEADFIVDMYEVIKALVARDIDITLVRLAYELNVSTAELSDYLPTIVIMLTKVEEEFEVQQKRN